MELNFDERRVLGVLMEKSYATPEQYPLTLNALVAGSNQKSCRIPVASLSEEGVFDALDTLRAKGLAATVRTVGGRTDRYRHRVSDAFQLQGKHCAVLAELLLRGPQTDGELRQRASRMVRIDDLEILSGVIDTLTRRDDPLVRQLSPPGRKRGVKFAHTLYPEGKAPEMESDDGTVTEVDAPASPGKVTAAAMEELRGELQAMRGRLDELESTVRRLQGI